MSIKVKYSVFSKDYFQVLSYANEGLNIQVGPNVDMKHMLSDSHKRQL